MNNDFAWRLAQATGCGVSVIEAAYQGQPLRQRVLEAIRAGAMALGLPLPPSSPTPQHHERT